MLSFLRLLITILSTLVGWTITIGSSMILLWGLWTLFYSLQEITHVYLEKFNVPNDLIPPTIPLNDLVYYGLILLAIVMLSIMLATIIIPIKRQIKKCINNEFLVEKVTAESHNIYPLVLNLAKKMNAPSPSVWIVYSNYVNAFVISPLGRHAMVFHAGLINSLSYEELEFVIAHELTHLKCKDARTSTYWITAARSLFWGVQMHIKVINSISRVASILTLSMLIVSPLILFGKITLVAFKISTGLFRFFDLAIGRQMEYRCDRIAAQFTSAEGGVSLLQRFRSFEGTFGVLFATHPKPINRLKRLKKII